MNKSESDTEERKIIIESKATILFLLFILIEGYILISSGIGIFPYLYNPVTFKIELDSPVGLYALYWIGIFCLISGIIVGKHKKIYPYLVFIGSIIFFLLFVLQY